MTLDRMPEALWINEPEWLCAFEFLNDEDPEGRNLASHAIGHPLGYAYLTNTRTLALLGDSSEMAYEILFSFSSSRVKEEFLNLIRSNGELGSHYAESELFQPSKDEILIARPLAAVLPQTALTRALIVAAIVWNANHRCTIQ